MRELMIEQFFLPFIVQFLRDSKADAYSIIANEKMTGILTDMNVTVKNGAFELSKLSKEQYVNFRYHFIEKCMYNELWSKNENKKAMCLLLNSLILILCKKVPAQINVMRIDKLHEKVKLLKPETDKNTKPEGAVLRLMIAHDDKGAEIDQDNKAVAVNGRNSKLPYTVTVLNQYASKCFREDFLFAMAKPLPEVFKDEALSQKI